MSRWRNHSGTAINVPVLGRDVEDGEEVEVPDDVVLPSNYFVQEGGHPPVASNPPFVFDVDSTDSTEGE